MTIHADGDVVANRFTIRRFVGEGGMQEVYAAEDGLLARTIALKTPKTASALKRFQRSAATAARVNHGNVAKTLDYLEYDGRYYLVEELVSGCDLGRFMRRYVSQLDPYVCARTLHHLSKGLAASHHAGVVHRDIKPTNVMVVGGAEFEGLKITDFGIAKMAQVELEEAVEGGDEALTASATALGALPYMAPEMIESFKDADKPADVWSLGALTFELATGGKPFGTGYRAVPLIQAAQVPPLPARMTAKPQFGALASEIYTVVTQCLAKDPEERPTADQLVQLCERLCYADEPREYGQVRVINYGNQGFISPSVDASDVFFHMDSVFGAAVKAGDWVWFTRHPGAPRDRAFPVVPAVVPSDT